MSKPIEKNSEANSFSSGQVHEKDGSWPKLDLVNSRLASEFGSLLAHKLQVALQGQRLDTKTTRYSDCVSRLGTTCIIFELTLHPLKGNIWFCMDISVIATIVESYFGGNTILFPVEEPRDLSRTEQRVVHHLIDALMSALSFAWSPIMPLAVVAKGSTTVAQHARVSSDEIMIEGELVLLLDSTELACKIIYPYETLKPYEKLLRLSEHESIALHDQQFSIEQPGRLVHIDDIQLTNEFAEVEESVNVAGQAGISSYIVK